MLKPGAEIQHTQGSIDLISLVGRLIFGQATQATQKQDQNAPQNGGQK